MTKKRAKEVGDKMRQRREALGLTQTEAARRVGWKQSWWSGIESGKAGSITVDTLDAIAKALETKAAKLL